MKLLILYIYIYIYIYIYKERVRVGVSESGCKYENGCECECDYTEFYDLICCITRCYLFKNRQQMKHQERTCLQIYVWWQDYSVTKSIFHLRSRFNLKRPAFYLNYYTVVTISECLWSTSYGVIYCGLWIDITIERSNDDMQTYVRGHNALFIPS